MTGTSKLSPENPTRQVEDTELPQAINNAKSGDQPTPDKPVPQNHDRASSDSSSCDEPGTVTTTTDTDSSPKDMPKDSEAALDPPLPPGPPPEEPQEAEDDGWQPLWDESYGRYYFYNSITGVTTWTNPRVPEATGAPALADEAPAVDHRSTDTENSLRYNPAIHGDYDPTAPYAQVPDPTQVGAEGDGYTMVAKFNRFTGKFQAPDSKLVPENYNDENKSRRQMQFYFDVDAAANSHDGRSLKAERQTKKLSKKELKEFKAKRREKKEQKRRAWLKD